MNATQETAREALVRSLSHEVRDERVLDAFGRVPRDVFVPADLRAYAYEDRPLPIGHGQTISQPLMVALMVEALALTGDERVLEIGTGSGYQAAILSHLARQVISVELVPELTETARERLANLGYANVEVHQAGDVLGWPDSAPYDAIIVAAGAPKIPREVLEQLAPGGRLVIPVGERTLQRLLRVAKSDAGIQVTRLGDCRFVPLIGRSAWAPYGVPAASSPG